MNDHRPTCMIAHPWAAMRHGIAGVLRRALHTVAVASKVDTALQRCEEHAPQYLLVDHRIALEAYSRLQAHGPTIVIVGPETEKEAILDRLDIPSTQFIPEESDDSQWISRMTFVMSNTR